MVGVGFSNAYFEPSDAGVYERKMTMLVMPYCWTAGRVTSRYCGLHEVVRLNDVDNVHK